MKKEYKSSMEQISLSESDRARILANVKKAYEEPETSDKMVPLSKTSRFSARRIIGVAAAFVVLLAGAMLICSQVISNKKGVPQREEGTPVAVGGDEIQWEELESVDDIPEQTNCRIYTLGKGAKGYKVAKVEVAREQNYVRLTYKNRKADDEILFEYRETSPAEEAEVAEDVGAPAESGEETARIETLGDAGFADQLKEKNELGTEKVGDTEVTMYGEKKCEAMTWEEDDTSFVVTMSKARSKKKAKELVMDTTEKKLEEIKEPVDESDEEDKNKALMVYNAVGWDGTEDASTEEEKKSVLDKFFSEWGFKIKIHEPASEVTYKQIDDCESYSFYYPDHPEWKDCLFIGYVGWHSCPAGVKSGFETYTTEVMEDNTLVKFKKNQYDQKMFTFHKGDLYFVFLLTNWSGELSQEMVQDVVDMIEIIEEIETTETDGSENTNKNTDKKNSNSEEETNPPTAEPDDSEPVPDEETGTPTPVPTNNPEEVTPLEE